MIRTFKNYLRISLKRLLFKSKSEDQKALVLIANQIVKSNLLNKSFVDIKDVEFQVFSQYGEDGIIQFIINKIDIPNKIFVEFGVEDYTESNTRFLLINNNWKGLVIDGSKANIKYIKSDDLYWRHNIEAVQSFITKSNINTLLTTSGILGDIGLLSIDIDGNDYWIWNEISVINPRIVIVEYNSILGPNLKITIPYSDSFVRRAAHHSNLYFGASLAALCELGEKKGYTLIGCNSNGNNAFFIRNDILSPFETKSIRECFVNSEFRESRDKKGSLTFLSGDNRIKTIEHLNFFDLHTNSIKSLKSLLTNK